MDNPKLLYKIIREDTQAVFYCPYIPLITTSAAKDGNMSYIDYLVSCLNRFYSLGQQGECETVITRMMKEMYPGNYKVKICDSLGKKKAKLIFEDPKDETLFLLKYS